MKKFLTILVLAVCIGAPMASLALSDPDSPYQLPGYDEMSICCESGSLVDVVTNWLFVGLIIVAVIAFIIAGYYFVFAQGDADKVKSARNFVMYAVIGLIVAFAAKGLIGLVAKITGS